jgi:hypothetical protein
MINPKTGSKEHPGQMVCLEFRSDSFLPAGSLFLNSPSLSMEHTGKLHSEQEKKNLMLTSQVPLAFCWTNHGWLVRTHLHQVSLHPH